MRKTFLFVLVLASMVLGARTAHAEGPLRLEDAVRTALANNERARKAAVRVEQAAGSLDRARTAFYPSLTAQGGGNYNLQPDRAGRQVTSSGTLSLSQPLLNPSAFPQYAQASHQLESERWASVQDRRVVAFDTARAFLQALAAERVFAASIRRLERAKVNIANAEARTAAGLSSINDATRATLDLATAARDVASSEGRLGTAYLTLGFLMGRRVQVPAAGEESPLAQAGTTTSAAGNFETRADDQIKAALDRRPDLRAAHERTEALRASAREPYYRLIPSLNAGASMRVNPDPLATEQGHSETITLNLSWQIFDAGQRYADMRTRGAQASSQALDESLLRRAVDNDIRTALVSLRAAREAFRIADEAIALAQRGVEETQILYKQGLARALELTDATQRAFDAEVTRASALLTMEQAYLELRFALGLGPIDDAEPAK
ncbi:MAG: TolC family protein [Labilithrix sp.]|nr:TolC family protein [Labilithrix sp.]MCW5818170.1 TolC family protein [Labilithrix sp.]